MNNYLLMTDRTRAVTRSMGHTWYGERRSSLISVTAGVPPNVDDNIEVEGDEQVEFLPILPFVGDPEAQENGNSLQDDRELWRATGRQLRDIADSFRGNNNGQSYFPDVFGEILDTRNLREIYNAVFEDRPVTNERMMVYTVFLIDLGITSLNQGQIWNFLMTFVAHGTETFFRRHGGWLGLLQYGLLTMANKTIGSIAITVRALYYATIFFRSNTI